ncbi:hypothetical protein [Haloplanus aerogenes]|uniref:Uncharacterized protein n=1 Tax=Haloplanus aerogenes TaxID=660522 RepID=A0A3M0E9N5_9EURY|nr:hypothetical protein [Haloplanus aerogenes]AZH25269.1 hypothetical protein DU502_07695 [Haloplanus aerogenes]RMB24960.1 hypothetical protein ATH50_0040 [Haloplanus aerogenes]
MSADNVLTEDDRQLLDHIDGQIDDADDATEFEEIARELRDTFARHRAEFRQFQHEVTDRLERLEDGVERDTAEEDVPVIDRYARMSEAEREDVLSTAEHIAVTLHDNWRDIAWKLGDANNRKVGVDTKTKANAKYNPSRLKHRLKQHMDRDLQSTEIYRGLQRLAKLSGGEEHVDAETSRVQIAGGRYEYRERRTADNKETRRVLWRRTE